MINEKQLVIPFKLDKRNKQFNNFGLLSVIAERSRSIAKVNYLNIIY